MKKIRFELIPNDELFYLANHSKLLNENLLYQIIRERVLNENNVNPNQRVYMLRRDPPRSPLCQVGSAHSAQSHSSHSHSTHSLFATLCPHNSTIYSLICMQHYSNNHSFNISLILTTLATTSHPVLSLSIFVTSLTHRATNEHT